MRRRVLTLLSLRPGANDNSSDVLSRCGLISSDMLNASRLSLCWKGRGSSSPSALVDPVEGSEALRSTEISRSDILS